jgi:hypothetical protein
VPEPQAGLVGGEHTGGQARLQPGRRVGHHALQQRRLHPRAGQRRVLEELPRAGVQAGDPREHRLPRGHRQRSAAGGEHLGDEERVAAGEAEQLVRGDRRGRGERVDGRLRQREQGQATRRPQGGEEAEHHPQRVVRGQALVPERGDQQQRQAAQPPAEEAQQVQRRLVGPVHVLDDDPQPGTGGQLPQQGREQRVAMHAGGHRGAQLTAQAVGEVEQRPERARGEQAVARTPGPLRVGQLGLELLEQRRLADAGLTRDQHQPTLTGARRLGVLRQRREERSPFEQRHRRILDRRTAPGNPRRRSGSGIRRPGGGGGSGHRR